jgi:hypothetical protein
MFILFSSFTSLNFSHFLIHAINLSTSPRVFPACKHTLTLCVPSGTVGGTIGLTINPASWQNLARLLGSCVKRENIGERGTSDGNWRISGALIRGRRVES